MARQESNHRRCVRRSHIIFLFLRPKSQSFSWQAATPAAAHRPDCSQDPPPRPTEETVREKLHCRVMARPGSHTALACLPRCANSATMNGRGSHACYHPVTGVIDSPRATVAKGQMDGVPTAIVSIRLTLDAAIALSCLHHKASPFL